MPSRCSKFFVGLLPCALGLGCEAELELPPVIESSEHLVLRGEEDVCAGTFDEMEARILAVQDIFGAPAAQVSYSWLLDRFPEAECMAGATACTRGHDIFAMDLGVEHELIHAARSRSLPAPLEEGIATFLGGNRMPSGTREELRLAIETDDAFSYQRASEFVQFLIQIGGFDMLGELSQTTSYDSSFSDWRSGFEQLYGQTWDEVWAAYLASPQCDPATMHDDVLSCYATATPAANLTPELMQPREYTQEMACDSAQVIGPVNGDELRHEALIQLDETGIQTLAIALTGDVVDGSRATLTRCGTCAGETGITLTGENWLDFLDVVPGLYVLELRQPADAAGSLGISVQY